MWTYTSAGAVTRTSTSVSRFAHRRPRSRAQMCLNTPHHISTYKLPIGCARARTHLPRDFPVEAVSQIYDAFSRAAGEHIAVAVEHLELDLRAHMRTGFACEFAGASMCGERR